MIKIHNFAKFYGGSKFRSIYPRLEEPFLQEFVLFRPQNRPSKTSKFRSKISKNRREALLQIIFVELNQLVKKVYLRAAFSRINLDGSKTRRDSLWAYGDQEGELGRDFGNLAGIRRSTCLLHHKAS